PALALRGGRGLFFFVQPGVLFLATAAALVFLGLALLARRGGGCALVVCGGLVAALARRRRTVVAGGQIDDLASSARLQVARLDPGALATADVDLAPLAVVALLLERHGLAALERAHDRPARRRAAVELRLVG